MLHESSLLCQVTEVTVSAVSKFVAKDVFKFDNPDGIEFYLWDDFKTNFLDKVEENVPASKLAVHSLVEESLDNKIIAELDDRTETTLAYLYELIKRQVDEEEDGPLLVDGYANIFYIRDTKGKLWVVYTYCKLLFHGWGLNASSVSDPDEWNDGVQIISQISRDKVRVVRPLPR